MTPQHFSAIADIGNHPLRLDLDVVEVLHGEPSKAPVRDLEALLVDFGDWLAGAKVIAQIPDRGTDRCTDVLSDGTWAWLRPAAYYAHHYRVCDIRLFAHAAHSGFVLPPGFTNPDHNRTFQRTLPNRVQDHPTASMLPAKVDAVVNPVVLSDPSAGKPSAALAKAFPGAAAAYLVDLAAGEVQPGTVHVWENPASGKLPKLVFTIPVREAEGSPVELDWLLGSLIDATEVVVSWGISSVGFPGIEGIDRPLLVKVLQQGLADRTGGVPVHLFR